MSRYIDADRLKTIKSIQSADFNSIETIRQWIDSAPSIDICFCRECKHRRGKLCGRRRYSHFISLDDFCSYGCNSSEKPNNSTTEDCSDVGKE